MRPIDRITALHRILAPEALSVVVDIGANPFAGKPPYGTLRRAGLCRVIGFEPQPEALAALQAKAGPNETYLPYAVGTGGPETLHLTRNSGLVSVLPPEPWVADYLNPWWRRAAEVRRTLPIETRRLDDMEEIGRIDFLKIDIQGGELRVFENARVKLAQAAVVQTEVAFLPYYQGQPSFGDIQAEMAAQGFIAHKLAEVARHHLDYPLQLAGGIELPRSQVTVMDVVFLRNPIDMGALETEVVRQMALLADAVLGSFDLALRCLAELARRGVVSRAQIRDYAHCLRGLGPRLAAPEPEPGPAELEASRGAAGHLPAARPGERPMQRDARR